VGQEKQHKHAVSCVFYHLIHHSHGKLDIWRSTFTFAGKSEATEDWDKKLFLNTMYSILRHVLISCQNKSPKYTLPYLIVTFPTDHNHTWTKTPYNACGQIIIHANIFYGKTTKLERDFISLELSSQFHCHFCLFAFIYACSLYTCIFGQ